MKSLLQICFFLAAWQGAAGADLEVSIAPRFNSAPLGFDSLSLRTTAGQTISITRMDALLSDIAVRRTDGTWLGQGGWFGVVNGRESKNSFTLVGIPEGTYNRLRFHIGLEPQINHGDAAHWPAGHPLNPDVNGLYWGWSHEYVFLALEGKWLDGLKENGFSFHLATDRELMTVELPMELDLTTNRQLLVSMDLAKIFSAPNKIELTETSDTTHSRADDYLATQLKENVQTAFFIVPSPPRRLPSKRTIPTPLPVIASKATPYSLSFSQFFPRTNLPLDNPLSGEGVELGSKLFFDRRLSANNSESCATCHRPRLAFSQPQRFSRGVDGFIGTRHAMALENLAWKNSFFWDGRAKTLREQVLQPIQNPIEMHESLNNVVAKVSADANYPRLFSNAFGSSKVTPDHIARALEQFLLVQVSCDAKFDRVMNGREKFSEEEQRGFTLFNTEYDPYHGQYGADCFHCHGGPLFRSQSFANNGLDFTFKDQGRYAVTKREGDQGKFAVPSLRNVALAGPYMHDGRFRTLEEAIEHYCTGMKRSATLDPNLAKHPDGGVPLSNADKQALAAFLRTLTDERLAVR
jgi:cytochrome c peroxidase